MRHAKVNRHASDDMLVKILELTKACAAGSVGQLASAKPPIPKMGFSAGRRLTLQRRRSRPDNLSRPNRAMNTDLLTVRKSLLVSAPEHTAQQS
jgi:hypothetical protein